MGFRPGAYAKIWSIEDMGKYHKANIQISRKNKETGEYQTDFSEFVRFIGHAHESAKKLKDGDRIKLGDCDSTTSYDAQKKITYHNYAIFEFELADGAPAPSAPTTPSRAQQVTSDDDPF